GLVEARLAAAGVPRRAAGAGAPRTRGAHGRDRRAPREVPAVSRAGPGGPADPAADRPSSDLVGPARRRLIPTRTCSDAHRGSGRANRAGLATTSAAIVSR